MVQALRPIYLIADKHKRSFDCFYPEKLAKGQSPVRIQHNSTEGEDNT